MLSLGFNEIKGGIEKVRVLSEKIKQPPLMFIPYIKRVLNTIKETELPEYPMDIKIPKPNKYLLKGDFEPAEVIHIEKPFTFEDGTPFWFNDSSDAINLRFGYKNLDARELSDCVLSSDLIHGFMGGSSGHGKSVTLNSMIGAICYEYAPWEVELHLSDAKIVEFKQYGLGYKVPHVVSIAATEDADYVISVLQRANNEMLERSKIFADQGVRSLKAFRKKTGLAYPRVVIIMDEVESTFRMAGRQADTISNFIDNFARLGRSSGYHIFMATQNMSSDIPKTALGQILVRCSLGANEATSQAILNNSGAMDNVGRKGRLIVNTKTLNGGNTAIHNVKYQTPLIEDDVFEQVKKHLSDTAKSIGYKRHLDFYDENDIKTVETFDPIINNVLSRLKAADKIKDDSIPLVLGYPAFVTDDEDGMLKITVEKKDVENILIASNVLDRVASQLHNLTTCLAFSGYVTQLYTTDLDLKEWVHKGTDVFEARSAETAPLASVHGLVRKRLFLLALDQAAESVTYDRAKVEQQLDADKVPASCKGNDLMCRRAVAFYFMTSRDNKEWEDIKPILPTFLEAYKEFEKCNSLICKLTSNSFIKVAFIIGDLSKIIGYGRDTREKCVQTLKKAMQDACRVNIFYILYSRSMESLTGLQSGIRYTIFDSPDTKDWGRMRADEPREVKPMLSVLFDNLDSQTPLKKFKRTLLRDEFS